MGDSEVIQEAKKHELEALAEYGPAEIEHKTVLIPLPETFVYSNCAAFSLGQNEIRLGFAEVMPDGRAYPRTGVVMPPETAAVVALVLMKQVAVFEHTFGQIRHPMWRAFKEGKDTTPFEPKAVSPEKQTT